MKITASHRLEHRDDKAAVASMQVTFCFSAVLDVYAQTFCVCPAYADDSPVRVKITQDLWLQIPERKWNLRKARLARLEQENAALHQQLHSRRGNEPDDLRREV